MFDNIPPAVIVAVFSILGSIIGIVITSLKVRSDFFKEIKEFYDRELTAVRKEMEDLRNNYVALEVRLEKKIERDIQLTKEANESEIKNLRLTIEQLRDEVRSSHSKLIDLLTSMISRS